MGCSLAAQLTYEGCKSESSKSYQVGGWCFYYYYETTWADNSPSQDVAQSLCSPFGSIAVGVTYKLLNTLKNLTTTYVAARPFAWLGLIRNTSYTDHKQGWLWNTLLPSGHYSTFPAIMSNMPWAKYTCIGTNCGEPNNDKGNEEAGMIINKYGVADLQKNIPYSTYSSLPAAVICQFAAPSWSYTHRGTGRFTNPAYVVEQATCERLACLMKCHKSVFCVALAFNSATSDCQIYGVSPEDPRFSNEVTANAQYDWHIRDGMEY
uniref:Apple domain-containing protein n=1 Tax=Plectus sambesii TaxID=2011161 RepID=A0A914VKE7_9BILA